MPLEAPSLIIQSSELNAGQENDLCLPLCWLSLALLSDQVSSPFDQVGSLIDQVGSPFDQVGGPFDQVGDPFDQVGRKRT